MTERPKLERYKTQWIVWVRGVGTTAPTPGEAIAEAARAFTDDTWCKQCAGTTVARAWDGTGDVPRCDGCGGTGNGS